jgi:hypothetical protein
MCKIISNHDIPGKCVDIPKVWLNYLNKDKSNFNSTFIHKLNLKSWKFWFSELKPSSNVVEFEKLYFHVEHFLIWPLWQWEILVYWEVPTLFGNHKRVLLTPAASSSSVLLASPSALLLPRPLTAGAAPQAPPPASASAYASPSASPTSAPLPPWRLLRSPRARHRRSAATEPSPWQAPNRAPDPRVCARLSITTTPWN